MKVPILMYHRIAIPPKRSLVPGHYVSPNKFRSHLRFIEKAGYQTITTSDLLSGLNNPELLPDKPIVLTFDDGYKNFANDAVPEMQRRGMTATVFMVSGQIGGHNEWDEKLGDCHEVLMTAEQLIACHQAGFEVGSHTINHAHLTNISLEQAESELRESKERLSSVLNSEINSFCYPYGEENPAIQELAARFYQSACSTKRGLNDAGTNRYQWRRINVRKTTSAVSLAWKILRARQTP